MNAAEIAGLVGVPIGVAGAVVATLGWRTAVGVRRDQADAENRRRHREMRPVLDVTVEQRTGQDVGLLRVKLVGPREVERYDRIRVDIRDDGKNRQPRGDVTAEAIRQQVWGPFRLRPGVDGANSEGRTAVQDGRAVTDEWLFTIERTTPPRWYGGGEAAWRGDYKGKPVRLRVEVGLGDLSWTELLEVPGLREVSRKAR